MSDPAPIILTAAMGVADQRRMNRLREAHFPPERNFLAAHVTLFHHLPGSLAAEIVGAVKCVAAEHAPPAARLDRLLMLGRGVAFHVDSPPLAGIREELAEHFHGLLTPQDEGRPWLHITVQNKVEPKVAKALFAELSAEFAPRPLSITGIAAHYYRGGPWEAIGEWRFRGKD